MTFTRRTDLNLLEGPLLPKILKFIFPLILTNLLQTLYQAADMIVVQLSGVPGAIGAIGTCGAMLNFLINVFIGFAVGANVVVAREIGKGNRGNTQRAVHTALAVSVLFGLAGLTLGLCFCRPILILLGDEGEVLRLATLYATIYCIGAPAMSLTNYAAAILRAKGDTKTPLMVLSFSGLANVLMNLFFVLVMGMSVDGVAIATVLSNVISGVWMVACLARDPGWCRFQFRKLRVSKREFFDIIRIGVPAGIQGSLFSLSNMIIQSSVVSLNNAQFPGGSAIIDGNAAGTSLEHFVYVASNSVYQAAITFVSQHLGAGKFRRMRTVIWECYVVGAAIATIGGLLLSVFGRNLLLLYIQDEASIEIGMIRLLICMPPYCLLSAMEIGSGVLRGLGHSVTSTVISLFGACFLRILWIYFVFPLDPTYQMVMYSYPITWGATALLQYLFGLRVRHRLPKVDVTPRTANA